MWGASTSEAGGTGAVGSFALNPFRRGACLHLFDEYDYIPPLTNDATTHAKA